MKEEDMFSNVKKSVMNV